MFNLSSLPWVLKKVKTSCGFCYKIGSQEVVDKDHSGAICLYDDHTSLNDTPHEEIKATAEFVIRSANNHNALVLACKESAIIIREALKCARVDPKDSPSFVNLLTVIANAEKEVVCLNQE